jgi:predicted site-specific integrase-resolvase
MEFSDLISLWKSIEGLPPAVQRRTKKHAKNSRLETDKALATQRESIEADTKEQEELAERVDEILNVICGRLYSSMEKFVYKHPSPSPEYRYIDIIRDKIVIPYRAKDYLVMHHSKSKKVIFKQVMPFILRQLESHRVATDTQETATNDNICMEIQEMILSGTHKLAGSCEDTKEVERNVITFECILDTWMEISKECVLIRIHKEEKLKKGNK